MAMWQDYLVTEGVVEEKMDPKTALYTDGKKEKEDSDEDDKDEKDDEDSEDDDKDDSDEDEKEVDDKKSKKAMYNDACKK